ncbi:MAG: tyrosine-type recombinase/integrase [Gemmatimonadetes bacterium]|nr:tyrosine-type recombinase/integrase [Gemmatimonadota bacterium]MYD15148.1 tyrosine-type recombinase/integrase [Gemmatimonadota bacterium]MYI66921.1 tyrosine-type recombinase/integrase [Gemmatimonadota bacterium]
MTRPKRLNATFVKSVKRPGRYGDGRGGHGLSLLVKPTQSGRLSKTWAQRLHIDGRAVNVGLGPYPVVTLADARKAALENRRVTYRGGDPRAGATPTFAEAAWSVVRLRRATWRRGSKSEAQWRASLQTYVFPVIGNKPVDRITTADVLSVLTPIWNEKRITAQRLRGRISYVMKWCIGRGYRLSDPAGDAVTAALPHKVKRKQHFRALPHSEVAGAMARVRAAKTWPGITLAFRFQVLTAARAAEVRRATWDEIDWKQRVWTVPAEHMKAGREHRVPLSTQALAVLREARGLRSEAGLLFPSPRGGMMGRNAPATLAHRLALGCVPHGFRSSFRDWTAETEVSRDVAEAALAHVVQDPVEAAYRRTDLFEQRRSVMEQWGDYVMPGGLAR